MNPDLKKKRGGKYLFFHFLERRRRKRNSRERGEVRNEGRKSGREGFVPPSGSRD